MKNKWIKLGLCVVGSLSCLLSTCMAYSTSSAITYSDNYALTPNSGYNLYGSDCTNYVSQCLRAGGLSMDSVWKTYISGGARYDTTAWVRADVLKNYLRDNRGATKIGSWQQTADIPGFYTYTDNSANLTNSNKGKVVIFYDFDDDWLMNHAAFFVVDNALTSDTVSDGRVTGDLINQHSDYRKHVIWNANKRNAYASDTKIYAFQLNV